MATKIYRDIITKEIVKYEPVKYIEEIHNFDITDSVVVCKSTGNICKLQDSAQWKERLNKLKNI